MTLTFSQLVGAGYRLLTNLDKVNALKTRWQPIIAVALDIVAMLKADPKLIDDTQAFVNLILPGTSQADYTAQWLQQSLNTVMDSNLKVDGNVGEATTAVVKQFQAKYSLPVDGMPGPQTCAALDAEVQRKAT
jgi:peptidoglycan hydrolase-like protein with peptidoglycan-binding domain